jgi:hypothetical protein
MHIHLSSALNRLKETVALYCSIQVGVPIVTSIILECMTGMTNTDTGGIRPSASALRIVTIARED